MFQQFVELKCLSSQPDDQNLTNNFLTAFSGNRFWLQELRHNCGKERKDYAGKVPFGKKQFFDHEVIQIIK